MYFEITNYVTYAKYNWYYLSKLYLKSWGNFLSDFK